jgi:hypothetical protein
MLSSENILILKLTILKVGICGRRYRKVVNRGKWTALSNQEK